jgi:transcriptional regulator with XRE-family HTH domain
MTNIANIFKSIRKELGLTQTEFALSLDVSRSAIAQIETSNNNPSNDLVKRLINTHKEIPHSLISKLKSQLEFMPDLENSEKNTEPKQSKSNNTKELLNGVKQFQKTMTSIEFVLTILKTRFYEFKEEEVEILKELDELVISKPFSILLGKSNMSIEDYSDEIDLKSILAEELLHEYIRKLYDVEFDLKENEFINFSYDNLLPDKDTDFD